MVVNPKVIEQMPPISLSEMDAVALMNRKDTKFILPASNIENIILGLKNDYRLLNVDGISINHYRNQYFDTKDFNSYHQHHNTRLNRFKFRIREYTDSGIAFFEIKFKNNKARTIKSRIKVPIGLATLTPEIKQFIAENSPVNPNELIYAATISFKRLTIVNNNKTERATLDFDLHASNENSNVSFSHLAIAELKQEGILSGSVFKQVIRSNRAHDVRVSKYCLCISKLNPQIKSNLFKPKQLTIQKIKKQESNA